MHDIFFFTDIHGHGAFFDYIMKWCDKQDPEATIIFGGDAIDRGPDGYRIMKALLDNPKVVYLKGNHEDMFVKATKEINKHFSFEGNDEEAIKKTLKSCMCFDYKYAAIQDNLYNGGLTTLVEWIKDGKPPEIVDRISKLPLTFSTDVCDFCHSASLYSSFKQVADAEHEGKELDQYSAEYILWGRTAIGYGWAPNRIAVYGHTPTPYLHDYIPKLNIEKPIPVKYTQKDTEIMIPDQTGTKINMDTGAIFTNRIFVLNCLTMKAQGFQFLNNKVEEIEAIQF